MADQNNAPERIWVRVTDKTVMYAKPSDADEFDVEYIRTDRAAPEGQGYFGPIGIPHWSSALTLPPAAPTDNTALVEALQNMMTFARSKMDDPTRADDMRIFKDAHAALASLEASPASQQEAVTEADLAAARAEIEQLTKERDEARAGRRFTLGLLDRTMTERDEARAQVVGAFEAAASVAWADRESGLTVNTKIRALTPDDAQAALRSMLADAERDMRQRAADLVGQEARTFPDNVAWGVEDLAKAILALPLKHADREGEE